MCQPLTVVVLLAHLVASLTGAWRASQPRLQLAHTGKSSWSFILLFPCVLSLIHSSFFSHTLLLFFLCFFFPHYYTVIAAQMIPLLLCSSTCLLLNLSSVLRQPHFLHPSFHLFKKKAVYFLLVISHHIVVLLNMSSFQCGLFCECVSFSKLLHQAAPNIKNKPKVQSDLTIFLMNLS